MNNFFLAMISENIWILIIGQGVIALGMIIKAWVDSNNRIQDRLDRESLARITEKRINDTRNEMKRDGDERVKAIIEDGAEKTRSIIEKVETVEGKADAAYSAGNGNQEKFNSVTTILQEHSKALLLPTQVEVMNKSDHPIPTVHSKTKN